MNLKYFTVFTSGHHDTPSAKKDWSDSDVEQVYNSTLENKEKIPFTVKHPKNESNLPIVAFTDSKNIRLIKEDGKTIIQARPTEISDQSIFDKLKDIFGNKISVRLNANNYGIEHLGMTPAPAVAGVDTIPFEKDSLYFEFEQSIDNGDKDDNKQINNNFTKETKVAKCKTCGANPDGGKCADCGADLTGGKNFAKGACPDCGANPKGGECKSCGAKPPKAKEEFSSEFENERLEFSQMKKEIEELKFEKTKLEFEKFLDSDNIKGIAIPAMRNEAFKLLKILPKEPMEFENNGTTIKEQPIDILKNMISKMKPSLNFSHDFTPGTNAYNESRDGGKDNNGSGKKWDDSVTRAAQKLNGGKLPEGVRL